MPPAARSDMATPAITCPVIVTHTAPFLFSLRDTVDLHTATPPSPILSLLQKLKSSKLPSFASSLELSYANKYLEIRVIPIVCR